MRGWTPEAFARATPEFMDAVRWGLFSERAAPTLAHWRGIQATPLDMTNPNKDLIAAKVQATEVVPMIEELLFPKDDDG
jgi:hypothetical protein